MLKFAICDDLTTEANTLKNHIERYAREKSLRVEIDAYSEAQAILAVLARIAEYDLVFLNIYMERLNGSDLARGGFVSRAIKAASSFSLHQKSTRWTPSASMTATI